MPATRSSLRSDFQRLGVRPGDLVMAHAAVRSVGEVTGGVNVILQALFDAIGPEGTLAAYVDFEPFYQGDEGEVPAFDKRIAHAARDHGVLHETLRNWPSAVRSDHPDAGVAAIGPLADWLVAEHPFQYGYGEGSPFEKIVSRGGKVLLLGAPFDTVTLLHYAEHRARIPEKRTVRYRRFMPGSEGPTWIEFEEFDTSQPVHESLPENVFERIVQDFLEAGRGTRGVVGQAESVLLNGRELVEFGTRWIESFVNSAG